MKTSLFKTGVLVLAMIIPSLIALGQGTFSYHYIIPPGLGDRLKDVKKIAFVDFKYTPPGDTGQPAEEDFDTEEELLKLMVEKQKKELLGDEAYSQLQASKAVENEDPMANALVSNITSLLIIPDRGKSSGAEFLIQGMRTDVYTIVDRADINRILGEQQFQLSGVVDAQQMSEIGALLGADAIISGDMASSKNDSRLPEKIEKVYKQVKYKDDEGKERTKSVFDYYKYIYTVQRTVTSNFNIQVVSVKTGQILGSKSYSANASDSKSKSFNRVRPTKNAYPSYSTLESVNSLARRTVNPISLSAANYISPRFGTITMKISKVKAKAFKKDAKEAADYLKAGRIEKAYAIYQTIYDADPYVTESAFNVGMIYEATGQYQKALEYYEAALESAVKNKNEKKFDAAVDRAKRELETLGMLNAIGIKLEKQGFSTDAAEALMAEKVQTKGNPKKDRYNVYESASDSSPVIGKVPGGREFPSFGVQGDYTKIEIIGGKRGYVKNDILK